MIVIIYGRRPYFKQKGKVVLLGDFNARIGKSSQVDDVIGMFGEDTCNSSGNRLIFFLNEVELVEGSCLSG